jgi:serine protease inhibitor
VFGFPATGLHEGFNALTRGVAEVSPLPADPDGPRAPEIRIANGLFPQEGLTVGEPFLRTLAEQYGVGVHPLDFRQRTAVEAINAWTRQQTAGRIHALFDDLPADTKLVLANAVYLRADWRHPFSGTTSDSFTRAGGGTASVPTMHQQEPLRYADGPGWQAVELPYAGSDLAMWVLVPAAGSAPDALLTPASLARVGKGLRTELVDLALPRWDFATTVDLIPALRGRGLTAPFEPAADFSGISPGLFVARAVQRATITVDERGTEAAAVTGLMMTLSGPAGTPVTVRADHPFAFAVVHVPTGTPLFVGRVADPGAR